MSEASEVEVLHYAVNKAIWHLENGIKSQDVQTLQTSMGHALVYLREAADPERGQSEFKRTMASRQLHFDRAEVYKNTLRETVEALQQNVVPQFVQERLDHLRELLKLNHREAAKRHGGD